MAYIWLQAFGFGFNPLRWFACCTEKNEGAQRVIKEEFEKLGHIKQGEYITLFTFITLVILWVTRAPDESVNGWGDYFPNPQYINDGMTVILVSLFLFILPRNDSGLFALINCFKSEENKTDISKLLEWKISNIFLWFKSG